jgi:hypothetical protein
MKKILVCLFAFSMLLADITPLEFDWRRYIITITTTEKTGMTDRLRTALFTIQYDNEQTIADYFASHYGMDEMITKLIEDYTDTQQNFLTDGGIEYVHQLPLTNRIMHELIPEQQPVRFVVPMLCPCCGQRWPENKPTPDTIDLIPEQTNRTDNTGIIFDCRGHGLRPCLFPKIVTKNGDEVFSVNFASLASIIKWGLVEYTSNDDLTPPRAGRKPLVISAIGTTGSKSTDIVITTSDARLVHGSKENVQLLKECRVVIIFGQ